MAITLFGCGSSFLLNYAGAKKKKRKRRKERRILVLGIHFLVSFM
jgi:hypothetical protein